MNTKQCTKCAEVKPIDAFHMRNDKKTVNRQAQCKLCINARMRIYSALPHVVAKRAAYHLATRHNPEYKADNIRRGREFYASQIGRAKTLLKGIERRAIRHAELSDVDLSFILDALTLGVCQVTGIPFQFEPHATYGKNPYAPSVDRIDNSKGYTKENTRLVLWQVNLMHGEMTDAELIEMCKAVIKGLSK